MHALAWAAIAAAALAAAPAAADHDGHAHHHGQRSHAHHEAPAAAGAPQGVSVEDCWIRGMPAGLPSAGYFTVVNQGERAVRLTGVTSPAFGQTMLHQTVSENGMARMAHVDAVEVPAGGTLAAAPGGYHAMLEEPTGELAVGTELALTFGFAEAGSLQAACVVRPAGATAPR